MGSFAKPSEHRRIVIFRKRLCINALRKRRIFAIFRAKPSSVCYETIFERLRRQTFNILPT